MCENETSLPNKIAFLFIESLAKSDKSVTKGHKSDLVFCFPPLFHSFTEKWPKTGHKQKSTSNLVQKLKSARKLMEKQWKSENQWKSS